MHPARSSYKIVSQIGVPAIRVRFIRQIFIDFRPGAGVPIAPHFYPADHKLDHAIHELKSILQS